MQWRFLGLILDITLFFFPLCCWLQEYMQDGIDCIDVEFVDNKDCLNLFEKVNRKFLIYDLLYSSRDFHWYVEALK